ncbi:conserved protein of unknown function (plasmid) [Rhodovastum atsumiense]|uniref:DUF968 domain-containing protein n=1 Tax=Rhodovastum atsumiense TaxID=504468 RepID=A0A5M6ITT5_9PROT|nr:hypothetical protein [Rhodovastum atsumiense]KAA5611631.1 hypothetical protein F1189_13810 [Rhodovastum atsumiense]CAH2606275.1 conserved protein of unknown function [Rhodovastum atsumiense]
MECFPLAKTRSRRRAPRQRRVRSCPHLAYVASLPCAVPWCRSCDITVHHLTHAEPKARGLKASDAATVPLCVEHHLGRTGVHHRGDERAWWESIGVDAIALAARLWAASVAAGRVRFNA